MGNLEESVFVIEALFAITLGNVQWNRWSREAIGRVLVD